MRIFCPAAGSPHPCPSPSGMARWGEGFRPALRWPCRANALSLKHLCPLPRDREPRLMKIAVVGGGPVGLYFAILMKKGDPRHDSPSWSATRADDSFGFGVALRPDARQFRARRSRRATGRITQQFAYWDDIEIHFRGELYRIGGTASAAARQAHAAPVLRSGPRHSASQLVSAPRSRACRVRRRRPDRRRRRHQQPLREATAAFGPQYGSAPQQVRLDGLDEAPRRLHLPLRGDAPGIR